MLDPTYRSGRELAHAVRTGELKSRELVEHFLARIERHNRALNAVVTLEPERARREADQVDAAIAKGESLGPLAGVPMTIKDSFEVSGMRTTSGAPLFKDHLPARDATAVARLRAAGAIVLGKSNVPMFCADLQTYNPLFGTTNNPWDLTRTPGGSSGGAAAALAAGLVPIELGSDLGGSIRTPAGFCGVYGHKPTHGLVPQRGHIPGPPGKLSEADLNVVGPLARSAQDLSLVLDVIAGPIEDRANAYSLRLPPARAQRLRDYRAAAWLDDPAFPVDSGVRVVLESAVETLRQAGLKVEEARPDVELRACYDLYRSLLDPVVSNGMPLAGLEGLATSAVESEATFGRNALVRHRDWLNAHETREQLRAKLAEFFTRYDVLLCPIDVLPAFPHLQSGTNLSRTVMVNGQVRPYMDLFAWISLATTALLPATVAPVGRTPEGLPVGMQIIGPYLEDRTTLDFAERAADVLGGFTPPPGF